MTVNKEFALSKVFHESSCLGQSHIRENRGARCETTQYNTSKLAQARPKVAASAQSRHDT